MEKFKDTEGKEWEIKITISTIKHVRNELKVDLSDLESIRVLGNDICLLVDCIYTCCKEEADKSGITDQQFGERMAGESIERASDAFMDELINFFPAQKANLLRKTLARTREILEGQTEEVEKRIADLSYEQLIDSQES